ncbi:MAG TPA: CHAT domain-containing protein, partial [Kofleriaceae bacterium]
MFDKLHLLSQDVPEGGDGFRWRAHPYLRMAGAMPRGPAVFEWSARQRADLEALWRDPASEGPRERLARDLAAFCERLGWNPDARQLEDAEKRGEEYMLTLSAVPPELYILPWEVIQVGATGTFLSDYASVQVRYAMPGLEPRPSAAAPPQPGVLFAWSAAGGAVPHEDHAAAIQAAAEAGGVTFRELADVDHVSLQAALDAGPPSVLHLLCHGLAGAEGEPSRLSWGPSDSPSEITATRLARMLRRHDGAIRLVVLSVCGSGDGLDNPMLMGSVAQELHKKGIASVVASRYPLSVCGSGVMTRALYDKLLREAWSLERALRHTRDVLLNVSEHGETHPGDAYGIQLYAYDTERFVSDNHVEAERPVLASYPFGTAARPVPANGPPATELTLELDADPSASEDELVDRLRRVSEDDDLTIAIPLHEDRRGCALSVHTTVDGAQRLLGAWRSKALELVLGVIVAEIVTKGIAPALQGLLSSAAGKAGALAKAGGAAGKGAGAAAGQVASAAGRAGTPTSQVGTAAKAGASAGKVGIAVGQAGTAAGQVAAVGAGKVATTAVAIAGKVLTAKIAVVALVSGVAVIGGAAVYETQKQSSASVQLASAQSPIAA